MTDDLETIETIVLEAMDEALDNGWHKGPLIGAEGYAKRILEALDLDNRFTVDQVDTVLSYGRFDGAPDRAADVIKNLKENGRFPNDRKEDQ